MERGRVGSGERGTAADPEARSGAIRDDIVIELASGEFANVLHITLPAAAQLPFPTPLLGRASRQSGGVLVTAAVPKQYLVFVQGAGEQVLETWNAAVASVGGTTLDVADGRATFRLRGPAAVDILSTICPFDAGTASPGTAVRTWVAAVASEIVVDPEEQDTLLVHCDRSYGRYLLSVLEDAAAGR